MIIEKSLVFSRSLVFIIAFTFSILSRNEVQAQVNTVIVTSATGELGGAAARALASKNSLILTGRNLEKLQKLQEELSNTNPNHEYDVCILDYSKEESIHQFKEYLRQKNTSITGFVLIGPRPAFYGKNLLQDQKTWHTVFQETFIGPFASLEAATPYLADKSRVVVISGISSIELHPASGPSGVVRAMTSAYTKALSHDPAFLPEDKKVSYNTISPGVVHTDYHQKRIENAALANGLSFEEQMKLDVAEIPLKRHAKPEDLAKVISFLVSEESEGINGVNLPYDGGMSKAL